MSLLAPYAPTPPDVVDRMLRLARVDSSDTVYDLGCGDGRIVIAAASQCGAKGFGIDIDAALIDRSRVNAANASVAELVRFEQRDVFDVDCSPATVVFLYLLHETTPRVMAHLLRQARPGTRIVSHTFTVEFMTPAAVDAFVDAEGTARAIHLWVVNG